MPNKQVTRSLAAYLAYSSALKMLKTKYGTLMCEIVLEREVRIIFKYVKIVSTLSEMSLIFFF
jgi:hypothetical protein